MSGPLSFLLALTLAPLYMTRRIFGDTAPPFKDRAVHMERS